MADFLFKRGFVLPTTVAGVVPAVLGTLTGAFTDVSLGAIVGAAPLLVVGLALLLSTARLFNRHGGSLAPWNPPERMVVVGAYRYVRNPMILGVFCIVAGEAIALRSWWIGLWWACFVTAQQILIVCNEEPTLRARFGQDYTRYREQVPRWIPRLPTTASTPPAPVETNSTKR